MTSERPRLVRAPRGALALGLLALLALVGVRKCDSEPRFDRAALDARLEAIADEAAGQRDVPSFVLRVEAPCLDYAFETARGSADPRGTGEAMTPDHAFWIASTTKTVTAVTVMKLAELGRLGLEDTLIDHLPAELVDRVHVLDGVSRGREITLAQLLGHTSGLWDHASSDAFFALVSSEQNRFWPPLELVEWAIANGEPVGPPGAQYHYSDFGYLLAGLVVEAVTGEPLHETYRSLVFEPLGMTSTYQGGYEERPDVPVAHPFFTVFDAVQLGLDPSFDWSGGGLISTAEDLTRFYAGLFQGRLLSEASLHRLLEAERPDLSGREYGFGIQWPRVGAKDWRGHGGFWGSWAGHSLSRNVTVAFSSSLAEADLDPTLEAIFASIPPLTCAEPGQRPLFERGPCPIETPGALGEVLECGRIRVPLRRDVKPTPIVELATIVRRAPRDASLQADPLVFLMGGPGGHAIETIEPFLMTAALFVNAIGRDFVAFDQRGTGFSAPRLSCDLDPEPGNETAYPETVLGCALDLLRDGLDLGAFSTVENARDVDAVRRALGAETWNLYGVSYGSHLALETLRQFPERIRSVVLDSPAPPQELFFENYPRYAQNALDGLLAACAADPGCAGRYPDLGARFERALVEAGAPGSGVPPARAAEAVRLILYDTFSLPALPRAVDAFARGDEGPLLELLGSSSDFSLGSSDGMRNSAICREWSPILSRQDLERAHLGVGSAFATALLPRQLALYDSCPFWPSGTLDLSERQPVESDVPTLILVGDLDPVTPIENAVLAASSLSNVQVIEFPSVGHAVVPTGVCPITKVLDFLIEPVLPLDTSCVAAEYGPLEFE